MESSHEWCVTAAGWRAVATRGKPQAARTGKFSSLGSHRRTNFRRKFVAREKYPFEVNAYRRDDTPGIASALKLLVRFKSEGISSLFPPQTISFVIIAEGHRPHRCRVLHPFANHVDNQRANTALAPILAVLPQRHRALFARHVLRERRAEQANSRRKWRKIKVLSLILQI